MRGTDFRGGRQSPPQAAVRRGLRPWVYLALGTALAAAFAFAGAALWMQSRRDARVLAALPLQPGAESMGPELTARLHTVYARFTSPREAVAAASEAGRLYHANDYTRQAEACWRVLHAEEPDNARWCYYLADVLRVSGDPDEVVAWLRETTRRAPDYAPAWLQLADLQFKLGRADEAEHAYQRRLSLLPGDAYGRLGLARLASQRGEAGRARELISQLVRDVPSFPPGHNLYADLLAADGDQAGAARERFLGAEAGRFRQADDPWLDELADWCFDAMKLCLRGTVFALSGRGDQAESLFKRAIGLRPDAITAYESLGCLYLDRGDAALARATFESGLRHAVGVKPSSRLFASLSRAYARLGSPGEARRVALAGLAGDAKAPELHDALADALGMLGEPEAAIESLRAAASLSVGDASAQHKLALALIGRGRLDDAVEALNRSLAANPAYPPTLALFAQIEADSGRWRSALRYMKPLFDSNPDFPEARGKMAHFLREAGAEAEGAGDPAEAERHYRAAIAVIPDDAQLHALLGAFLMKQRRFSEAVGPLETGLRASPRDTRVMLLLGQAYMAGGRVAEARTLLKRGAEQAEQAGDADMVRRFREWVQRVR